MMPKPKMFLRGCSARFGTFLRREDGSMTVLGLFFFMSMAVIGAIAVDGMSVSMSQVHLQKAADQAAHAALYSFAVGNETSEDDAEALAVTIVQNTLPTTRYGEVIRVADDFTWGSWDLATRTFTAGGVAPDAVRAVTQFDQLRLNALQTFLFHLVGQDEFDISRHAIFTTLRDDCLTDGLFATGILDIQSGNAFTDGFCLHSNGHVEMNNLNTFELGTSVTMPNLGELVGDTSKNPGLAEALGRSSMTYPMLELIDDIITRYRNPAATVHPDTPAIPSYITNPAAAPVQLKGKSFDSVDFTPGTVYDLDCVGNSAIQLETTVPLRDVVIVTDCELDFKNGGLIDMADVQIFTSNTDVNSISSPALMSLGDNDNCAAGGEVVLGTLGGVKIAAQTEHYGTRIYARDNVEFTALAVGHGASFYSGADIDSTSGIAMAACPPDGTGMELAVTVRMVE